MPSFHIAEKKGKFVVVDAEGVKYGTYDTREEAAAAIEDWKIYYAN